jgi:phosphatidylethanolamine/phosphatidyl-N-methylethanolamine N-methyltransferase
MDYSPGLIRNARIARFYDRVIFLYPLVDFFCAPGRRRLIEHINREPAGRLLEIGVGPGRHLPHYLGHTVTAIDCSAKMVASSRRNSPGTRVRWMDGEALRFPDASFDYVTLCHVLSVSTRPETLLSEVHRVLRPGGRLFVLNHETPAHAWRHVDAILMPLSALLHFRSWFRLNAIPGIARFRITPLAVGRGYGLMKAYSLEK